MEKPKTKKKTITKRPQPIPKKAPSAVGGKNDTSNKTSSAAAKKSKSAVTKVKSPISSPTESENDDGDGMTTTPTKPRPRIKKTDISRPMSVATVNPVNLSKKSKTPAKPNDGKELVVRKRMASLNASAMLAAAYEVERHLDRVESMATSETDAPKSALPKKIKDIKDEVLESKDVIHRPPHTQTHARSLIIFLNRKCFFPFLYTGKARFHQRGYRSRHRCHHYRRLCQFDARLEPGSLL